MNEVSLARRWQFLPHPIAALYQSTFLIRRALFKKLKPIAQEMGGDILDFGCGSKPYRSLFSACTSYIGVDIAVSGHDHADSNVDIYYDGHKLPFDDGAFDAIVAFEVFEHVFNIDELLQELKRVLRPGGRILLTLPFAWGEHEAPYDFARYTSFGIRSVIERNGMVVHSIEKTNASVEAIQQLWLAYIDLRLLRPFGLFGKVVRVPIAAVMNLAAIVLGRILPEDGTFYSNLVIQADRPLDAAAAAA
ncbi:class I SAM-dependent methyltransferase [Sphingomonas adhaesiva]|nr:class I SAM-dependent methyltransferase [Sphingomonas adhaesiva]